MLANEIRCTETRYSETRPMQSSGDGTYFFEAGRYEGPSRFAELACSVHFRFRV